MFGFIPGELLYKVLEKLPIISLICASSVCKSWYYAIRHPCFITQYLNRVTSPSHIVRNEKVVFTAFMADRSKIGLYSLSADNSCDNILKLDLSNALDDVEIVGICSGLVCLLLQLRDEVDRVIIWNPIIRKSVSISCTERSLQTKMFYGFCVHPATHEYKVLALSCANGHGIPYYVEIYKQHTGTWIAINYVVPHLVDCLFSRATVNGVVHWLSSDWSEGNNPRLHNSIATFNMHTEAFSEMSLPPSVVHVPLGWMGLGFSSESLVMYEMTEGRSNRSRSCIWVMKEYGVSESWIKLLNFELPGEWRYHLPLGLRMNGELLLATQEEKSLLCHDHETNRTTNLSFEGSPRKTVDTYVESLLLLTIDGATEHEPFGEFRSD